MNKKTHSNTAKYLGEGLNKQDMLDPAAAITVPHMEISDELGSYDNNLMKALENYYNNYCDPINANRAMEDLMTEVYGGSPETYREHLKEAGRLVLQMNLAIEKLELAKNAYYEAVCKNISSTDLEEEVAKARLELLNAEDAFQLVTDKDENIKSAMDSYVLARQSQNSITMNRALTGLLYIIYGSSSYLKRQ